MDFCAQPGQINFCAQAADLIKVRRLNQTLMNNRAEGTKVMAKGCRNIFKPVQADPGRARPSQSELGRPRPSRAGLSRAWSRSAKRGTAETNKAKLSAFIAQCKLGANITFVHNRAPGLKWTVS